MGVIGVIRGIYRAKMVGDLDEHRKCFELEWLYLKGVRVWVDRTLFLDPRDPVYGPWVDLQL